MKLKKIRIIPVTSVDVEWLDHLYVFKNSDGCPIIIKGAVLPPGCRRLYIDVFTTREIDQGPGGIGID